tara:strand:- start:661 stop:855 length:195 start_codon:yes stop_codon:yes gene_type:complete
MNQIRVGMKVTTKNNLGILEEGVVLRIDREGASAGVLWRIEGGIMTQTVPLKNLVQVNENEQQQ